MMRWVVPVALSWLPRQEHYTLLRAAIRYRRLDPVTRLRYRPPPEIYHRWQRLLALALLMTVTDSPWLAVWFGASTLLFAGMMLARWLVA